MTPVSNLVIAAFAALTIALAALWAPRFIDSSRATMWWIYAFSLSLAFAVAGGLVGVQGILALLVLAAACYWARRAAGRTWRLAAHAVMVLTSAALLLHAAPGFDNPLVLNGVVLGDDSEPYTKYLNFDKGAVGLFLLGIYAPDRAAFDRGLAKGFGLLWRFVPFLAVVTGLSLALHYVRWDPKLPSWWPLWIWSMVFLTALPEEAVFRGVAQDGIERWFTRRPHGTMEATVLAGMLFGLAHAGGGVAYVVLAAVAGIGYGWVYATSRSMIAAILAHTTLNTIHLMLFSYPSLIISRH